MVTKITAFCAVSLVGLFHSSLALAQQTQQAPGLQQPPWGWPGPWHMWHDGWGFWWICPLIMFIVFIICAAIFLFSRRSSVGSHHWQPPWQRMDRPGHVGGERADSALKILNERFARSEIQKLEYEEKKTAILSSVQG